jgi:coenzyme F420 hydrogenase subunit beta
VRDRLDLRPLDRPEGLDKLEQFDKKIAFKSLERPFDPDAPMFVEFEEHIAAYQESDRAPVFPDR